MKIFGKKSDVIAKPTRRIATRRRIRSLGEVDYSNYVQVAMPVPKRERQRAGTIPPPEICWVKITKGNKQSGEGILDHEPREATQFKVGTVIRYETRAATEYPHFVRKVHVANQKPALLKSFVEELRESLTFNPNFGR